MSRHPSTPIPAGTSDFTVPGVVLSRRPEAVESVSGSQRWLSTLCSMYMRRLDRKSTGVAADAGDEGPELELLDGG